MYMTAHFPGFEQAGQKVAGLNLRVAVHKLL
jgi:hypothetical protein